jgi:hypothetical protein
VILTLQEDISKLEMKVVDEAKKLCPDKYDWLEDDTVPPGWKYRWLQIPQLRIFENIYFLAVFLHFRFTECFVRATKMESILYNGHLVPEL